MLCLQEKKREGNCVGFLKTVLMQNQLIQDHFFCKKFSISILIPACRQAVRGKWKLVEDWREYEHISASFYELNKIMH
jgi:hypothetical protein